MALKVGELFASFGIDTSGLNKSISGIEKQCANIGKTLAVTGAAMSAALTKPIMEAGKAIYQAGTDFGAQMSRVEGISGASADEITALTNAAIEMGSTTAFTATEAGEALEYMAMAGWKTDAMLAGLGPVMDLAAASGEQLGTVSDIVTDAMTAFGLTMESAGGDIDTFNGYTQHFADVLAAASSSSNTNVGILGESFKYVATIAGSAGYSIDEMAVSLGILANNGIKGSQAGTGLARMINNMLNPTSDEAAELIEQLGIKMANSDGTMREWTDVVADLRKSFSGLTEEEKIQYAETIAGQRGMTAMLALVNATDEDFQSLTTSIQNCDGATSKMASTMLDNAKGDITLFNSAVEGLEITLWNLVEDSFRSVVQGATDIINSFREMDEGTQKSILKIGGFAAAIGPASALLGGLVAGAGKLLPALTALISPLGVVTAGLALMGLAIGNDNNDIGETLIKGAEKLETSLTGVDERIKRFFVKLDENTNQLAKSVTEALNIALPGILSAAGEIVLGIVTTISNNAQEIADVGKTIVTNILKGIGEKAPELIPTVFELVTNIYTALINNIPEIVAAAGEMAQGIWDGFMATDWLGLGTQIITAVSNAFKNIGDLFTEWFAQAQSAIEKIDWDKTGEVIWSLIESGIMAISDFITLSSDLLVKIIDGMSSTSAIEGATGMIKKIAVNIIDAIIKAIPTITTAAGRLIEAVGKLFTVEGAGTKLIKGATSIAKEIITAIINVIPTLKTSAESIVSAIGNLLSGLGWSGITDDIESLGQVLIDGIISGIEAAGDLGVMIVDAVVGVITSINWESITVDLKGFALMLINGIVDGIAALANGATKIVTAISEKFSTINWKDVGAAAADLAITIFDGIIEGVKKITPNMDELISAIVRGIIAAVSGLSTAAVEIVKKIGQYITDPNTMKAITDIGSEILSGLADGLATIGPDFENKATLIKSALEGIGIAMLVMKGAAVASSIPTLMSKLIGSFTGAVGAINPVGLVISLVASTILYFWNTSEEFRTAIIAVWDAIKNGLKSSLEGITKFFTDLADGVKTAIAFLKNPNEMYEQVYGGTYTANPNIVFNPDFQLPENGFQNDLNDALADLGFGNETLTVSFGLSYDSALDDNSLSSDVEAAAQAAAAATKTDLSGKQAELDGIISQYSELAAQASSAIEDLSTAAETNMSTAVDEASSAASDFSTAMTSMATASQDAIAAMTTAISDGKEPAEAAALAVSDSVVQEFLLTMSYDNGTQIGVQWLNGVLEGMASVSVSVKTAAGNIASAADKAASDVLSYDAGYNIGTQFDNGIAAGIRGGVDAIKIAARVAAQSALTTAKLELDIRSPSGASRREIGYMFDEGIALGVLERIGAVESATERVGAALMGGQYVGEPSRGTVYTASQSAKRTAQETVNASNRTDAQNDRARAIGEAIAQALIESDALSGDVLIDGTVAGVKTSAAVSKTIANKSNSTITGRSVQGVISG